MWGGQVAMKILQTGASLEVEGFEMVPLAKIWLDKLLTEAENYTKSAKIEEKNISSFSTKNNNSEHAPLLFFNSIREAIL